MRRRRCHTSMRRRFSQREGEPRSRRKVATVNEIEASASALSLRRANAWLERAFCSDLAAEADRSDDPHAKECAGRGSKAKKGQGMRRMIRRRAVPAMHSVGRVQSQIKSRRRAIARRRRRRFIVSRFTQGTGTWALNGAGRIGDRVGRPLRCGRRRGVAHRRNLPCRDEGIQAGRSDNSNQPADEQHKGDEYEAQAEH